MFYRRSQKKETPAEYKARKIRVRMEHREYLQREAARQQRKREYLQRQAEREKKFEFNNTVLKWRIIHDQLICPNKIGTLTTLLPKYSFSNARQYYFQSFKPLIMMEAQAIVKTNLAQCLKEEQPPTRLILYKCQHANNPGIPSKLNFSGRLQIEESYGRSAIVLWHVRTGTILLANIQDNYVITAKCFIDEINERLFRENSVIEVYPLGSLITQMRMYEVCINMPYVYFEQQIINPRSKSYNNNYDDWDDYEDDSSNYDDYDSDYDNSFSMNSISQNKQNKLKKEYLNSSQNKAVQDFLQLNSGLQLLQGPPGTGKTTTLAELIGRLCKRHDRILVAAPSNKAICVLAKKFMNRNQSLNVPIILVGVKEKIDPDLQDIFLHDWLSNVIKYITDILNEINSHLKKKEISEEKCIDINKKLQNLLQIINRFQHLWIFSQYSDFLEMTTGIDNPVEFFCKSGFLWDIKDSLYQLKCDLLQQNNVEFEEELLKHAKVIFATLSVTGRYTMKVLKPVEVLIVDEAAQAVEAETLIPFMLEPKKCLLVGDTKQLPATIICETAKKYHYDWSMMRRLIEECKVSHGFLDTQYRMESKIRRWPSKQYYRNRLRDSKEIITGRHNPLLSTSEKHVILKKPYIFIDVIGKEKPFGHSYRNEDEAKLCVMLAKYFCQNKNVAPKDIGIISFYAGQVTLIKKLLHRKNLRNITVNTVDGFQGDEKKLIILSFVRANPKGYIGFVKDFRRLNVAITRAKFMLILLGNVNALGQKRSDVCALIEDARKRGIIFSANSLLKEIMPKVAPKITPKKLVKPARTKKHVAKEGMRRKFFKDKNSQKRKPGRTSKRRNGQTNKRNNRYKYKTELCKFFARKGSCRRGNKCPYAHGKTELRI
jgi:predicted DNA helicase